ncbi:MAG: YtxH domain-containing protein [Chloroflexi bacterium]|nr:YtxH domain-containing protein [Chloroflexota bacterium]
MFGLVRTAVRFFFIGFGVGILLAPRAGAETRTLIREKLNALVNSVLEVADRPPVEGVGGEAEQSQTRGRARGRRADTGAGATPA